MLLLSDPERGEAVSEGVGLAVSAFGIAPAGQELAEGLKAIGNVLAKEIDARRSAA
jgi:hypothetical protein